MIDELDDALMWKDVLVRIVRYLYAVSRTKTVLGSNSRNDRA